MFGDFRTYVIKTVAVSGLEILHQVKQLDFISLDLSSSNSCVEPLGKHLHILIVLKSIKFPNLCTTLL